MKYDYIHTSGDTLIWPLAFSSNSVATNLTGSEIVFSIKQNVDDVGYILQKTATLTDAVNGLAEIKASDVEMNLPVGIYYYDVQWTDAQDTVRTFLYGGFTVKYQLT